MEENFRILVAFTKVLNPSLFYSLNAGRFDITAQGYFKPETVKLLLANKFKSDGFDLGGYLIFTRGKINVILT